MLLQLFLYNLFLLHQWLLGYVSQKGSAPPISWNLLTQKAIPEIKSQSLLPSFTIRSCVTEGYLAFEKVTPILHWFWELQPRGLWIYVYADIRFSLACAGSRPSSVKTWQIERQCQKISPVGCLIPKKQASLTERWRQISACLLRCLS